MCLEYTTHFHTTCNLPNTALLSLVYGISKPTGELCHIQLSGKILLNLSVEMKERVPYGDDQESRMRSFSGSKQYVSVSKLHVWKILHLGECRGATHLYKLYRYVPPHRVGFWRCFGLQSGIHFPQFGLESGMVFKGTTGVYERFNSKWVRNKEKYTTTMMCNQFSSGLPK